MSIAVFPECDPSIIYGMFDTLWAAGRMWSPLVGVGKGEPLFEPRLVSGKAGPMTLVTGVQIIVQDRIDETRTPDILLVPNVVVSTPAEVAALDRELVDWIRRMSELGVPVYASCGGSIVLAEARLLDGQEATTHWGYVPLFRQLFPSVKLHEDRILVQSGRGHDIVCSGGASSWQDLCLLLIARHAGIDEALRISKLFLYQWHHEGQLPFAAMIRNCSHRDGAIAQCQEWIADNYACKDVVAALQARTGLAKRTFDRRFKAATGYSPLAYVQALRIEEAKQLLETNDRPVDEIGRAVGYEDAASFRRLFRRSTGMAPGDYRRKFKVPTWIRARPSAAAAGVSPRPAGKPIARGAAGRVPPE